MSIKPDRENADNRSLSRGVRVESGVQVVILVVVGLMAGAASFRHVHDWTMRYSLPGTGSWFGWVNAMVTELIPTASGLEARRRKRTVGKAGRYPIALIVGAMILSLLGQFAEAQRSVYGFIVAAIPAVGFVALVKLILSRPARVVAEEVPPPVAESAPVDVAETPVFDVDEMLPTTYVPAPVRTVGRAIGSGIVR
jgi:hypothetical protein